MGDLVNRDFTLNLGGTRVAAETVDGARNEILKVEFSVERSLSKSANTADVTVYNLSEQTRQLVSEKAIDTVLDAGYSGNSHTIFRGKLDAGKSWKNGADWVTNFQSTDGGKQLREKRINVSYSGKLSLEQVFDAVADSLGVGLGNAKQKIREGNIRGAFKDFQNGIALNGYSRDQLDKLTKAFGYTWSIQDGQLELLGPTDAIDRNDAIVLNSNTGLLGSPQSGEKGIIEARSLLIPQLIPGRVVSLDSKLLNGFYRVDRVVFTGDTRGQAWYADTELKPL